MKPLKRLYAEITAITILFVVMILSVLTGGAEARKKKEPEPPPPQKVILKIVSEPAGATVVIDRVIRGRTPVSVEVEKGLRLVRVSLDENWSPYIQEINLEGDFELNVELKPINEFSYKKGKEAFEKGDYPLARRCMNDAVSGGKVIADAYFYLALLDRIRSDNDGMIKNLKEYVGLNPPSGDFVGTWGNIDENPYNYAVLTSQYFMGEYYRETYNWAAAATAFKLSIPRRERFIDANLEPSYANIRKLRATVTKTPGDFKTQIQLAYLYELKGMLFQSMMAYRDGVRALYRTSPDYMARFGGYVFPSQ